MGEERLEGKARGRLVGGEGDGRRVLVDLVGKEYFPRYIGVGGQNYVYDPWSIGTELAYVWWPPGASEPLTTRWE